MKKQKDLKFEYWHLITKVSKEYQKDNPDIKVGLIISNRDKRNGSICLFNLDKKKEYKSAYTLKYLTRLPTSLNNKEKIKILKTFHDDALQKGDEK